MIYFIFSSHNGIMGFMGVYAYISAQSQDLLMMQSTHFINNYMVSVV